MCLCILVGFFSFNCNPLHSSQNIFITIMFPWYGLLHVLPSLEAIPTFSALVLEVQVVQPENEAPT